LDLLYHRSGPSCGQSRGYAFVTYETLSEAIKVLEKLNGKKLLSKNIIVKWAHSAPEDSGESSKPNVDIPVLTGVKKT